MHNPPFFDDESESFPTYASALTENPKVFQLSVFAQCHMRNSYECLFRFHNDKLVQTSGFAVQALSGFVTYSISHFIRIHFEGYICFFKFLIGNNQNFFYEIAYYIQAQMGKISSEYIVLKNFFSKRVQTFFSKEISYFCKRESGCLEQK